MMCKFSIKSLIEVGCWTLDINWSLTICEFLHHFLWKPKLIRNCTGLCQIQNIKDLFIWERGTIIDVGSENLSRLILHCAARQSGRTLHRIVNRVFSPWTDILCIHFIVERRTNGGINLWVRYSIWFCSYVVHNVL